MSSEHFPYVVKRRLAGRGLLLGAVVASAAGCFSPNIDIPDCAISCISECPSNFECRNGFCARSDSDNQCALGGSAGTGGGAGVGGSTSTGGSASTSGMGGAGNAGNAPMVGGAGGAVPAPFELTIPSVPELCPGQAYELAFGVSGGVAPYAWSVDPGTVSLSASTGSSTKISGSADASHPNLEITVVDATGATQTAQLALSIGTVVAGSCVEVVAAGSLPAACTNNPYAIPSGTILRAGGTAPYTWEAISIPQGLQFDPKTQAVSGTALPNPDGTPLTLRVTDSNGRQSQLSATLEYRDKCWLAFTQTTNGDTQLRMYDPALDTHASGVESSSNNTGVVDFAFSTDGELITYRRATSDRNQELVLVDVANWQEQVLRVPGSVLSYAWSPQAAILAVAYLDQDGNTWLGGIDATHANSSPSSVTLLNPTQVMDATYPRLNSDLLWLENGTLVAFHAPAFSDSPLQEGAYVVAFDGATFNSGGASGLTWPAPVELFPAVGGLFVVSNTEAQTLLDFTNYVGDESDAFLRGSITSGVADPAGKHVAVPFPYMNPTRDELELYSTAASGGTGDPPMPWNLSRNGTLDQRCDSILSWNPTTEEVVCDGSNDEVRLYELDAASTAASEMTLPQSDYHSGGAGGYRRSFSPHGDRFAFTTRDTLYVANRVSAQIELTVALDKTVTPGQLDELAFAPDQSILLWQTGNEIGAFVLAKNGHQQWFGIGGDDFLPPPACSEEFAKGPRTWCGRSTPAAVLSWDPSSRFAAAISSVRGIRVLDFSQFTAGSPTYAEACSAGCNTDFVFQP